MCVARDLLRDRRWTQGCRHTIPGRTRAGQRGLVRVCSPQSERTSSSRRYSRDGGQRRKGKRGVKLAVECIRMLKTVHACQPLQDGSWDAVRVQVYPDLFKIVSSVGPVQDGTWVDHDVGSETPRIDSRCHLPHRIQWTLVHAVISTGCKARSIYVTSGAMFILLH